MEIDTEKVKQVRKRDGKTLQLFNIDKIKNAVRGAWIDVGRAEDPDRMSAVVDSILRSFLFDADVLDVETIQDTVEVALMHAKLFDVAKAYILYRQKRAEARVARRHPDPLAVSDYIHAGKYARYRPEDQRRELFEETVARDEQMHLRKFGHVPALVQKIKWAFGLVRQKRVLPSMRSMQFGGAAIEKINDRIFNCSATHIDRLEAFSEAFFLLLCGCGVGYSIQFEHVDKLPEFVKIDRNKVMHHVVKDTIEGWADALKALMFSYMNGTYVEFAYHEVRPKGVPLRTSGGRAPGHLGLKFALERVREVLEGAQGRRMRPIECHRIMCHVADAVLSGGVRRSSLIALFSFEDSEMMYCKTGNWFAREPWFANANNSVVLKRDVVTEAQFKRIFQMTKEFGEPGFLFVADYGQATNPCAEIALNPRLKIDYEVMRILKDREKRGKPMPDVKIGEVFTGFAFCNLTEINAAMCKSRDDLIEAAHAATFIGTLQASYTDMEYLGWVSEVIAEREALLGVGMTGMMDSPAVALSPDYQREVAERVVEWNTDYAAMVGIRPAARTTCVKPSGTTSLELGCVGSGIHPHHARRYIRRVTANAIEPVFQYFKSVNPHMCVLKPNGDWTIEFPVEAPDGAILNEDLTALHFLEIVKSTQQNWVAPGTARPESSPGFMHNVSNTVLVKSDEWDTVSEYVFKYRELFSGVSFLPVTGDKDYQFAPREAIVTEADEARWNQLLAQYKPVDYTYFREEEDNTDVSQEPACANGACEIK